MLQENDMINCKDCEFCKADSDGHLAFSCDPFSNIKEPECINKWMLLKIDLMVRAYQATLDYYRRLAPLQERMFKHVEKELDDMDESEKWKIDDDEDQQENIEPDSPE